VKNILKIRIMRLSMVNLFGDADLRAVENSRRLKLSIYEES
jgi:hypothetical protein